MGLLKLLGHAVAWPVTGPAFLTRYSMGQARDAAVRELTDDEPVRRELLELQLRLDEGRIDEQAYEEEEAALMQRLREVREWREKLGMPVQGGPVRMEDDRSRMQIDIETTFD